MADESRDPNMVDASVGIASCALQSRRWWSRPVCTTVWVRRCSCKPSNGIAPKETTAAWSELILTPQAAGSCPARCGLILTWLFEDSVGNLKRGFADRKIDLFMHDSLHTYEHETHEYRAAVQVLAPGGVC